MPEIPENPGNFPKNLSDGISGNFGKFFPGIPGNSGNPRELFRKFGGFSRNARCGAVYPSVKRGENRGKSRFFPKKVPGKSPENPPGNPREIPGKNGRFFPVFFRVHAKIQPISGKSSGKIPPENSRISGKFFPGKSPESPKIPEISGKKGSKMTVFGKIDPLLHTGF